jgi:hypothetical protein
MRKQFSNKRKQFFNIGEQFSNEKKQFSNKRKQFSNEKKQFSNKRKQFSNGNPSLLLVKINNSPCWYRRVYKGSSKNTGGICRSNRERVLVAASPIFFIWTIKVFPYFYRFIKNTAYAHLSKTPFFART